MQSFFYNARVIFFSYKSLLDFIKSPVTSISGYNKVVKVLMAEG